MSQVEDHWKILKLSCTRLSQKERGLELVSLPHFLHDSWRRIFLLLYYINWPNFIDWLPLLSEILGNISIAVVCWPVYDIINFEINLISNQSNFSIWPKIQDKNLNILRRKRAFKMKQKVFSIIFSIFQTKFWKARVQLYEFKAVYSHHKNIHYGTFWFSCY